MYKSKRLSTSNHEYYHYVLQTGDERPTSKKEPLLCTIVTNVWGHRMAAYVGILSQEAKNKLKYLLIQLSYPVTSDICNNGA